MRRAVTLAAAIILLCVWPPGSAQAFGWPIEGVVMFAGEPALAPGISAAPGKGIATTDIFVSNERDTAAVVDPGDFALVDEAGRVYDKRVTVGGGILAPVTVEAGQEATIRLAFDVPAGAWLREVRYRSSTGLGGRTWGWHATVFRDVSSPLPFFDAIGALQHRGIVSGFSDGLFGPWEPVLRQQFAKTMVTALGVHTAVLDAAPAFADIASLDTPYPLDYIAEAVAAGIMQGYPDGLFGPDGGLTRAQLALIVFRAARPWLDEPSVGYAPPFADVPVPVGDQEQPEWAGAVTCLAFNGMVDGRADGTFDPGAPVNRGQAAQVVYRMVQLVEATLFSGSSGD